MIVIDINSEIITGILVYTTLPNRQQEIFETLQNYIETVVKTIPGFISASLHKSLDGTRVANYAQWQNNEYYDAFFALPETQALIDRLLQFSQCEKSRYTINYTIKVDNYLLVADRTT